jgi:serine/threonine protein kinase
MLSGGKLLDQGLYGCIFTPPLECKNKKKQALVEKDDDLQLSKLILTEYAKQEEAVAVLIRKIPLWKNYFVVSETMCEPAVKQTEKDLPACVPLDKHKLSQFRLLAMPYGGTSFHNHKVNLATFDLVDFAGHFIQAGAILNLFGVVHRDIHGGNILVDSEDVPRIIDFNLAIFVETHHLDTKLEHQYTPMLAQEPPDSTLVNAVKFGYKPMKVIDSVLKKRPSIKKMGNLLGVSLTDMREQLETFYEKSKAMKAGDDAAWFRVYWRTIDSWAIGMILVELIHRLSLWPEYASKLERAVSKLRPVLTRLCAVSPLERIDCVQALYALEPNHFIIRKYAKSWLSKVGTGGL